MPKPLTLEEVFKRKPIGSKLTPIKFVVPKIRPKNRSNIMLFLCDCGQYTEISVATFCSGNTRSCGCLFYEVERNYVKKYSLNIRKIYHVWRAMKSRCYDPKNKSYKNYGLIGVKVCDEWINNYQSFLDWALQNGYKSGLELDKDILGNGMIYSPQTCCWVSRKENSKHKKNTVRYEFNGEMLTLGEVSEKTNMPIGILRDRVYTAGKTIYEAVYTPIKSRL